MLSAKCPGQDRRNWKPEDIFEHPCPNCEKTVEFWKTDVKRTCPECKTSIINPRLNLGCALWCDYAEQCVGDISEVFSEKPEALKDKLELETRRYFIGETGRWNFNRNAAEIASGVLELEKEALHPVVLAAVYLNDIGYARCKKEGNETTKDNLLAYTKDAAEEIMGKIKLPSEVQEKTLQILKQGLDIEDNKIAQENPDTLEDDANHLLLKDIFEIANLRKRTEEAVDIKEEKKELINKLNRKSAKTYLTNNF